MKKLLILSFFLLSLALVLPVYAEGEISLTDLPTKLAEQLDISLFAGQILASGIMLMLFLLPTLVMTKNQLAPLFAGLVALGITIALGWLPVYLFAILTLLIALMFANKISRSMS